MEIILLKYYNRKVYYSNKEKNEIKKYIVNFTNLITFILKNKTIKVPSINTYII